MLPCTPFVRDWSRNKAMCFVRRRNCTTSGWTPSRPPKCPRTSSSTSLLTCTESSTRPPQRIASCRWSLRDSSLIHSCTFSKVALSLTFVVVFVINSFLYDYLLCYLACYHV